MTLVWRRLRYQRYNDRLRPLPVAPFFFGHHWFLATDYRRSITSDRAVVECVRGRDGDCCGDGNDDVDNDGGGRTYLFTGTDVAAVIIKIYVYGL